MNKTFYRLIVIACLGTLAAAGVPGSAEQCQPSDAGSEPPRDLALVAKMPKGLSANTVGNQPCALVANTLLLASVDDEMLSILEKAINPVDPDAQKPLVLDARLATCFDTKTILALVQSPNNHHLGWVEIFFENELGQWTDVAAIGSDYDSSPHSIELVLVPGWPKPVVALWIKNSRGVLSYKMYSYNEQSFEPILEVPRVAYTDWLPSARFTDLNNDGMTDIELTRTRKHFREVYLNYLWDSTIRVFKQTE